MGDPEMASVRRVPYAEVSEVDEDRFKLRERMKIVSN
jgi:hypothetical protein